jgi:hypothetical protein
MVVRPADIDFAHCLACWCACSAGVVSAAVVILATSALHSAGTTDDRHIYLNRHSAKQ